MDLQERLANFSLQSVNTLERANQQNSILQGQLLSNDAVNMTHGNSMQSENKNNNESIGSYMHTNFNRRETCEKSQINNCG